LLLTILIFSGCTAATTRVEICFAPEDQKDRLIRSIRKDYMRGACASTDVTLRTPLQGGPILRTHRLLLAAASPLLFHLLTTAEEEEPIIVFDETVTDFELEQLLVLLYNGEVRVDAADRDRLSGFKAFLAQLGIDNGQLSESSERQTRLPLVRQGRKAPSSVRNSPVSEPPVHQGRKASSSVRKSPVSEPPVHQGRKASSSVRESPVSESPVHHQGRKASSSVLKSPVSEPPMRQPSLPLASARPVHQTHSPSPSVPLTQSEWESAGHPGPLPGPLARRQVADSACPDSQRKRRMSITRVPVLSTLPKKSELESLKSL
jgi:hypothetical protein